MLKYDLSKVGGIESTVAEIKRDHRPEEYNSCTFHSVPLLTTSGIEKFINITKLTISASGIKVLGGITNLKKLEVLILSNNKVFLCKFCRPNVVDFYTKFIKFRLFTNS
jgi:Leucine-rich repeat (LRR) protein